LGWRFDLKSWTEELGWRAKTDRIDHSKEPVCVSAGRLC
jgi:hypothetical protein